MFCSNCGFQLPDAAAFCPECGNRVEVEETPTEIIPEAVEPEVEEALEPEEVIEEAEEFEEEYEEADEEAEIVEEAEVYEEVPPQEAYEEATPQEGAYEAPVYEAPKAEIYAQPNQNTYSDYSAPSYQAPQAPQGSDKYNGLAIAGFCVSLGALIINFFGLISIVGTILSFIAFNKIKTTGEKGRGMAIAGIVVGIVVTVLSLISCIGVCGSLMMF